MQKLTPDTLVFDKNNNPIKSGDLVYYSEKDLGSNYADSLYEMGLVNGVLCLKKILVFNHYSRYVLADGLVPGDMVPVSLDYHFVKWKSEETCVVKDILKVTPDTEDLVDFMNRKFPLNK